MSAVTLIFSGIALLFVVYTHGRSERGSLGPIGPQSENWFLNKLEIGKLEYTVQDADSTNYLSCITIGNRDIRTPNRKSWLRQCLYSCLYVRCSSQGSPGRRSSVRGVVRNPTLQQTLSPSRQPVGDDSRSTWHCTAQDRPSGLCYYNSLCMSFTHTRLHRWWRDFDAGTDIGAGFSNAGPLRARHT